jgi:hypothetical protein
MAKTNPTNPHGEPTRRSNRTAGKSPASKLPAARKLPAAHKPAAARKATAASPSHGDSEKFSGERKCQRRKLLCRVVLFPCFGNGHHPAVLTSYWSNHPLSLLFTPCQHWFLFMISPQLMILPQQSLPLPGATPGPITANIAKWVGRRARTAKITTWLGRRARTEEKTMMVKTTPVQDQAMTMVILHGTLILSPSYSNPVSRR